MNELTVHLGLEYWVPNETELQQFLGGNYIVTYISLYAPYISPLPINEMWTYIYIQWTN